MGAGAASIGVYRSRHRSTAGSERGRGEEGSSIATVLALGVVAAMLVTIAAEAAISDLGQTRNYIERQIAFYAAEAGLAGFLSHINDDPQWIAMDPAQRQPAYFPGEVTSPASPNWAPVPAAPAGLQADYTITYTIVPTSQRPPRPDGGILPPGYRIVVTGRFRNSVRSIQLELERQTFLSFMYMTEFEAYDPGGGGNCLRHFYPPRPPAQRARTPTTPRNCNRIDFVGLGGNPPRQDVLNGPVKSNDSISACGNPRFRWPVESGRGWVYRPQDCTAAGAPIFEQGVRQCGLEGADCPTELPTSNQKLKSDAEAGGYVYQGPIEITPLADGRIRVYSRFGNAAVATGPANARTSASAPPNGNPASPPPNGVIYVQNWPGNPTRPGNIYVGTPTRNNLSGPSAPAVSGRFTLAAQNNIYIWTNLVYADQSASSRDVIGLVANNSVLFGDDRVRCNDNRKRPHYTWHAQPPSHATNPRGYVNTAAANIHEVQAAMIALSGNIRAYGITNPPDGSGADGSCGVTPVNGTLRMRIAMAQRYRGAVGTYSGTTIRTGYVKDYNYDERLGYIQPPRFLEPTNANWVMLSWREIPPAFR